MTEYVAGFLFNDRRSHVVLIDKHRPAWQAGYLNGVGGKIEEGESPLQAMVREFQEETGLRVTDWQEGLVVIAAQNGARIHFFRAFTPDGVQAVCRSTTDEPIDIYAIARLNILRTLPNLKWIIPVLLGNGLTVITVIEAVPGGFPKPVDLHMRSALE